MFFLHSKNSYIHLTKENSDKQHPVAKDRLLCLKNADIQIDLNIFQPKSMVITKQN